MLSEIIKTQWPFGAVRSIERYEHGAINDTYHIVDETGEYSVRVYRNHALPDVEFEVALLEHVSGLPVPKVVPINGSNIWNIGEQYAIVYKYIPGEHLGDFTPGQLNEVGRFLAHFHTRGQDFSWQGQRHEFYRFTPSRVSSIMALCEQKSIGHYDVLSAVKADVEQYQLASDLPQGPIHVDVKPQNVLYQNGELRGVLDFDNAYIGPYVLDLAKSMMWFGFNHGLFDLRRASHIYEGYSSVRSLSELERKELYNALKFAFASHILADFEMYASNRTPKEYFDFMVNDFYKAYQSFIHTPESLREFLGFPSSVKDWRQQLQLTAPEGGHETYVGRTIRFWSIYLTMVLARTPLTPNKITVISVLIFLGGVTLFVFNDYWLNITGVGLVYLSIIFDASDGEIARLKGNKSKAGPYVEPVSHDIQYGLLFIPLTIGLYRSGLGITIIYVGFLATIFKLWIRFLESRFLGFKEYLGLEIKTSSAPVASSLRKLWSKRLYFFVNRNIFSSVGMVTPLLVCALFNRLDIFVWLFMTGFGLLFLVQFSQQARYISRLHFS